MKRTGLPLFMMALLCWPAAAFAQDIDEWLELVEMLLIVVGPILSLGFIFIWWLPIHHRRVWPTESLSRIKGMLSAATIASVIIIYAVIGVYGTWDVRTSAYYTIMYVSCGVGFLGVHHYVFQWVSDILLVPDAIHRKNYACVFPLCGGLIASAVMYAFMNMGYGEGWWCVFLPYLLCWGFWLFLSWLYLRITDISEKITVGRDVRAGIRCGGFFLISGVMIAFINVGDYITFGGVLTDFLLCCWPVLILFAAAVGIELKLKSFVEGDPKVGDAPAANSWAVVGACAVLAIVFIILFAPPVAWEILSLQRRY